MSVWLNSINTVWCDWNSMMCVHPHYLKTSDTRKMQNNWMPSDRWRTVAVTAERWLNRHSGHQTDARTRPGCRNIGIDFLPLIHPVNHIKGLAQAREDRNRNICLAFFPPLLLFFNPLSLSNPYKLLHDNPALVIASSWFWNFVCKEKHLATEMGGETNYSPAPSSSFLLYLTIYVVMGVMIF